MRSLSAKETEAIRNHFDEIIDHMIEMDLECRPYQMDLYFYPETGEIYDFVNVGGNSYLDDDHITLWSVNHENGDYVGLTADEMRYFCNENRSDYEDDLNEFLTASECRIWYAVQCDRNDDWGTGSFDLKEAEKMCRELLDEYQDALIAAIDAGYDESGNPTRDAVCVDELFPGEDF